MAANAASNKLWAMMPVCWEEALKPFVSEHRFEFLAKCVLDAYEQKTASPGEQYLFRAFEFVEPNEVRVVILGHDPYANPSLARGLSFAIPKTACISDAPSLKAIRNELINEYPDRAGVFDQSLASWANQGVLLLNTLLTVKANGKPGSHGAFGWRYFTDAVLRYLDVKDHTVFLLWGEKARKEARKRNLTNALRERRVLEACHPSFQRGKQFFGCNCFKEANDRLEEAGVKAIEWIR